VAKSREPKKAEVAAPVDDEGLLACVRRGVLGEVKPDEQIGGQANAFPSHKQQKEAGTEYEHQHKEHEEVEVGKEAPVAYLMRHVADRVEVNQKTYPGDDAEHDQRQMVDGEGKVDVKAGDGDPAAGLHRERKWSASRLHGDPETGNDASRSRREEQRNGGDECARELPAKRPVDQEAGEGQCRDEPEKLRVHAFRFLGGPVKQLPFGDDNRKNKATAKDINEAVSPLEG
jgi:hypothetical protein